MIAIIDYDLANLYSVKRAVEFHGNSAIITDLKREIYQADKLIIPGVGAFGEAMANIRRKDLLTVLKERSDRGVPILGICLGMQLLMSNSEESGEHEGLGLIKGDVKHFKNCEDFDKGFKVPCVGWSEIKIPEGKSWNNTLLKDIQPSTNFYFVHSYVVKPSDKNHILAQADYGKQSYCAVVQKKNIVGCQFHPEKSGKLGLKILRRFCES